MLRPSNVLLRRLLECKGSVSQGSGFRGEYWLRKIRILELLGVCLVPALHIAVAVWPTQGSLHDLSVDIEV